MKLVVTGGAGFIGSNFIRYILRTHADWEVLNIDKLTYAGNLENLVEVEKDPRYKFVREDICHAAVADLLKGYDAVLSFAAETHVDRSLMEPEIFLKTDVLGAFNLIEAVKKHHIGRYVQISCYDDKTKAFTRNGLKQYDEIKEGDLVLTLNVADNKVEWKPVEKVIIQDYQGPMISMLTDTVDLLVTPNHRMLFQMQKSKNLIYKTAEDAAGQTTNRLPKYYKWEGKNPSHVEPGTLKDFMYILGIFIGDGCIAYQEKILPNKTGLNRKEFLKKARNEAGQFTTVGKIGSQEETLSKSWRVFLDIPEKDKCRKKCEETLTRLGIRWHAHKGKAGEHIYFTSKRYFEVFKECGIKAKNKRIPSWALETPEELLLCLLDGLLDSDGGRGYVYFTVSYELATQIMILCAKLGFNPILKTRFSKSRIGNRTIKGSSFYILISRQEWRGVRKDIIRENNYEGKIWCLKIKDNKNFLVERNGKIAFCGNTDEVYGSIADGSFTEESPLAPSNPYSASKAGADLLVLSNVRTYGLPAVIVRSSNNYGPNQYPEKFIPLFITNAMEDRPLPVYGDGRQRREWLYVEDNCRGIETALLHGKDGEIYNISSGNEEENIAVAKRILQLLGKPDTLLKYVKDRLGHDRRYSISAEKLRRLGWSPVCSFDDGLARTVRWYQENSGWWNKLKDGSFREYYTRQYEKR